MSGFGRRLQQAAHAPSGGGGSNAPSAPQNIAVVMSGQRAELTWAAPASNGGSSITGYTVTTSPAHVAAQSLGSSAASATVFSTGAGDALVDGTQYTFAVAAKNANGTGTPATITGTPWWPDAARSPSLSGTTLTYYSIADNGAFTTHTTALSTVSAGNVPPGCSLSGGVLTVNTPGQTLTGWYIPYQLMIRANNVTMNQCAVVTSGIDAVNPAQSWLSGYPQETGFVMNDSYVSGGTVAGDYHCFRGDFYELHRVTAIGSTHPFLMEEGVWLYDCFGQPRGSVDSNHQETFFYDGSPHALGSNATNGIIHCYGIADNHGPGYPSGSNNYITACLSMLNDYPLDAIRVENSFFTSSAYSYDGYFGYVASKGNSTRNIVVVQNVLGRANVYPNTYGLAVAWQAGATGNTWTNNVDDQGVAVSTPGPG